MKRIKVILLLASTVWLLTLSSVAMAATEKGNGKVVTTERSNPGTFTEIEIGGILNVRLIQGDEHAIQIETDENLQDKVITNVKNNRLEIHTENIEKATKLEITIICPTVTKIIASGASNIDSESIFPVEKLALEFTGAAEGNLKIEASQSIDALISGACTLKLEGKTPQLDAVISGASKLNATEMSANVVTLKVSGASKATAYATEKGEAIISGISDAEFVKSETAIIKITREGQGIKEGEDGAEKGVTVSSGEDESVSIHIGDIEVDVKDGESTRVRVGGKEVIVDEDGNVDVNKINKTRFDGHWGGLHLGINGFLTSDNKFAVPEGAGFLEPKYQRSWQFNLNLWEQNINLVKNKFGLTTGVGFQWNNYFFKNNVFLHGDSSMIYGTYENIAHRSYEKSKLVVSYLSIPLLMEYQTNKYSRLDSFHATAGMVMGIQLRAHTKNVYSDNGTNKVKGWEDYNLSPFRFDAYGALGWGKVNLFASYAINTLFAENQGPEVYPITVGITLLGW
ncbi:MAG: DUF2807 domain-containing protein [Bacteroidales bacterium]|nr:DUF2807 domain-containing protein [Bacteroidales bacterium]MDY0285699.1 DUF2807 domain-containing protein [Bacteroidales bacterium]